MIRNQFRKQYMFWLDLYNPLEDDIAGVIESLKETRMFSKTIRDGIRLVNSLREGRVDVLLELFPWVKNAIVGEVRIVHAPAVQSNTIDTSELGSIFTSEPVMENPTEVRKEFSAGFGDLFADDDDDLW